MCLLYQIHSKQQFPVILCNAYLKCKDNMNITTETVIINRNDMIIQPLNVILYYYGDKSLSLSERRD